MKLHEYEGAAILQRAGIPIPEGSVVSSPADACAAADRIGPPGVVEAQVLVGGRGLAGGVKTAKTADEAAAVAEALLGSEIKGLPVKELLVVKKVEVDRELYLGVSVDGYHGQPMVILSGEGGVAIEQVPDDKLVKKHVDVVRGLRQYEARAMAKAIGLDGKAVSGVADVLSRLYQVFRAYDCMIVEINPLAVSPSGEIWAIDAVLEIDDSAMYRHPDIQVNLEDRIPNPLERAGRKIGVTYVDLDGDVGIIASGAGLGMATMDVIAERYRPANFLETGGGITEDLMYKTMDLVMGKERLRGIFINIYGGINPIHEGAKGVVSYMRGHNVKIPVVAKALGNRQEETWETFRSGGVVVVTDVRTEVAVREMFRVLDGG